MELLLRLLPVRSVRPSSAAPAARRTTAAAAPAAGARIPPLPAAGDDIPAPCPTPPSGRLFLSFCCMMIIGRGDGGGEGGGRTAVGLQTARVIDSVRASLASSSWRSENTSADASDLARAMHPSSSFLWSWSARALPAATASSSKMTAAPAFQQPTRSCSVSVIRYEVENNPAACLMSGRLLAATCCLKRTPTHAGGEVAAHGEPAFDPPRALLFDEQRQATPRRGLQYPQLRAPRRFGAL